MILRHILTGKFRKAGFEKKNGNTESQIIIHYHAYMYSKMLKLPYPNIKYVPTLA